MNEITIIKKRRVILKEEIHAITNDLYETLLLCQLIYWQQRCKDYDKYIIEEKNRQLRNGITDIQSSPLTGGWIYKTAEELGKECFMDLSTSTIRKYLLSLKKKGFIKTRRNPLYPFDKSLQYKVDMEYVIEQVKSKGYDGIIEIE